MTTGRAVTVAAHLSLCGVIKLGRENRDTAQQEQPTVIDWGRE